MRRVLPLLIVVFAVWHAQAVWRQWGRASVVSSGNDFASYHYAVRVAADGGDPYDPAALSRAARQDRTRTAVHPFFYPPPFLAAMAWTLPLDLGTAYRAWFWLDELCALLCALVLWRWWRPLGNALPVVLAAGVALMTAIPNNHVMGQANLPVLGLVLAGLWQAEEGREGLGGALVGVACMLKMSPALFVAWWLLHRRWRPVAAACATGVALTLLSLPLAGPDVQWTFYAQVLPGFGSGSYNGLKVPINLFGNHSIPDLYNRAWPAGGHVLSPTARALSTITGVVLVAATAWWARHRPEDTWATAVQVSGVALLMLLLPVYTYEHHLVWALPGMTVAAMAVVTGRVPRWWAVPVALGWLGLAFQLSTLKRVWQDMHTPLAAFAVREIKFAALLLVVGVVVALGVRYVARREETTA